MVEITKSQSGVGDEYSQQRGYRSHQRRAVVQQRPDRILEGVFVMEKVKLESPRNR